MRKISGSTFFTKKLLPALWLGFMCFFPFFVFFITIREDVGFLTVFLVFLFFSAAAAGMCLLAYIFVLKSEWKLVDKVFDNGHELVFHKGGKEQHVNIRDIVNVYYSKFTSTERIILHVRSEGPIGNELAFRPPFHLNPLTKSSLFFELKERVAQARKA